MRGVGGLGWVLGEDVRLISRFSRGIRHLPLDEKAPVWK